MSHLYRSDRMAIRSLRKQFVKDKHHYGPEPQHHDSNPSSDVYTIDTLE